MKFEKKQVVWAYIFLLPSLIGIAVFYVIPYIMCVYSSFVSKGSFAGLDNYINLFQNKAFLYLVKCANMNKATIINTLTMISIIVFPLKMPHAAPVFPPFDAIEITCGMRLKYSTLNKKCLVVKSATKTRIIVKIIQNHFFILFLFQNFSTFWSEQEQVTMPPCDTSI